MPTNSDDHTSTDDDRQRKPDLVALDAEAVRATIELVDNARPEDLKRPTPCVDWTLHGLLAHMATQNHGFAAASTGDGSPELWKLRSMGDDPLAAYRESAERVLAAFAVDDLMEREFPLPEFREDPPFPAEQALSFHLVDYVVHAWDVAKTLDLPVRLGSPAVEAAYDIAQMVPVGEARLVPGAAFGPAVPSSGGSRLDELVAHLGRTPSWSAYGVPSAS